MDAVIVIKDIEKLEKLISKGGTTIYNGEIKEEAKKWVEKYYNYLNDFAIENSHFKKTTLAYLTKSLNNQRLLKKKWLNNLRYIRKALSGSKFIDNKQVLIFDPNKPYSAYQILKRLFSKAKKEILIFDGYVEEGTLDIISIIQKKAVTKILTNNTYGKFMRELPKFKKEFPQFEIRKSIVVHDRFFVIDDKYFLSGNSLHSLGGKKASCIFELDSGVGDILKKHFNNIWNQSVKL